MIKDPKAMEPMCKNNPLVKLLQTGLSGGVLLFWEKYHMQHALAMTNWGSAPKKAWFQTSPKMLYQIKITD